MNLEQNEIRARPSCGLDHETILSEGCRGDGCEIPLFYDDGLLLRSEWCSAETSSTRNNPIQAPSTYSASGFELPPCNPLTLPHGTWNQLLEPSFPNHLEQMKLALNNSEEYLRQPLEFLSPCNESLSSECSHPVIQYSSPNCHLSESESLLPFEHHSHVGTTLNSASSNAHYFSKLATGHEASRYVSLGSELSLGLSSCSSGSQLATLSIPPNLDYHDTQTCRTAPPSLSIKRSLPILGTGVTPNAVEIKQRFPGFDESGRAMAIQNLAGLPNSASKYPSNLEGYRETTESCPLQPSRDLRTHSSSSRSSSHDQSYSEAVRYPEVITPKYFSSSTSALIPSLSSSAFFDPKVLSTGTSHEPQRRGIHNKKQDRPEASASANRASEHQNSQRRIGSLIDIHHLTSHVPRRRLTVEQEQILLGRFAVQEYLSKREMEELAEKLKIPTSQLRTWFGNRRSKLKAAARQKAKMEAGMGHFTAFTGPILN